MNTTYTGVLVPVACYKCSVVFGLPKRQYKRCLESGDDFYCSNGHGQCYSEPENKRLRDALAREKAQHDQTRADRDRARQRAEHEERRARVLKGHHTRLKRRVAHGVCPCCKRTFANVARHMETQHAAYVARATP